MTSGKKLWLGLSAPVLGLLLVLGAGPGVPEAQAAHTIKIGHTNPYSGPAAAYGTIGRNIRAYFEKINKEGGVNGHFLKFISYDDGYSPPKTVEQVRKLVERDKVHMLFQTLGTPTNSAIHRYVNKKKVPHLFVATGASKWGNPKKYPWTMGWQPNYQTEGKIFAEYIIKNVPNAKIGILFQNDDYGKDYVVGLKDGLASGIRAAGMGRGSAPRIVMEQSYEVSDPTIDSQIVNLKNSGANVFYNITTPKAAAQSIKKVRAIGWNPVHLLNSVGNSTRSVLKPAGFGNAKGIISLAYAKVPTDPRWKDDPATKEFFKHLNTWVPKGSRIPSFGVYAYNVTQTLVHVLRQAGDDLSRENIMRQAANIKNLELPMLLPGVKINTSPTDFYPIEQMNLMRFDGKSWVLFGKLLGKSEA